jgi:AMP-binding enzyme/Thioesterase domain/AMP-binding enzyme C-terminal domain/Phosphopantetheine attachment site
VTVGQELYSISPLLRNLRNMYGPTETTIWSSAAHIDTANTAITLGEAIHDTVLRVLDEEGQAVPTGGVGELCIGGTNLARGYLRQPGLTAERFVPDPCGAPGSRLYRTGDLCRLRADGSVEFLRRLDQQVKLRGFRIELGEIEAALRQCAGVRDAVAVVQGEGEGRRLIGYAVGPANAVALKQELEHRLPGYMVPSVVLVLESLPLTPNGKVDRRALPEPDKAGPREAVMPRTETEAVLLDIWQRVLERADLGVTDNFFDVGGDSLSALRVAVIARRCGLHSFTLEALFTRPVLATLATHLDAHAEGLPASILPLNDLGGLRKLFCVHPGYGLVNEYRATAQELNGVATVYGVQSPIYSEADWRAESFDALALEYVGRIRQVQPEGPYYLLGWSLGGWVAVSMAHHLEN